MSELVVITGLSGSGKSLAASCFEDLGYFCVDNLPVALIPPFYDLVERGGEQLPLAALVIDVREGRFLEDFPDEFRRLKQRAPTVSLLFFECSDEVLKRRFSESRRPHPMAQSGSLEEGIHQERQALKPLRDLADRIIDTSNFTAHQLRNFLSNAFGPKDSAQGPVVNVVSFGFKYGLPSEADLVFDVRFLPNPYFIEELRTKNGTDAEVREFLDGQAHKREFVETLQPLLDFLLPRYAAEGKSYLTLCIGCTGGKHRSVALAEEISRRLAEHAKVTVTHRDLGRE